MRSRIADVAGNVCIRDERPAEIGPKAVNRTGAKQTLWSRLECSPIGQVRASGGQSCNRARVAGAQARDAEPSACRPCWLAVIVQWPLWNALHCDRCWADL